MVDKDGNLITNERTKAQALGKALNAMTMHSFLTTAKVDENMTPYPEHRINAQVVRLRDAIEDDPNISLYIAFGLFMAINGEETHGIPEEQTKEAFNRFMTIMNKIK